jgi:hypothetical protein
MTTNHDRAQRFAGVLPYYDDDEYSNSIDLLADCQHWCHEQGHDFDDLLRMARNHFSDELAEVQETKQSQRVSSNPPTATATDVLQRRNIQGETESPAVPATAQGAATEIEADPEPWLTNAERALSVHRNVDQGVNLAYLLMDLKLWCDRHRVDFERCLELAGSHLYAMEAYERQVEGATRRDGAKDHEHASGRGEATRETQTRHGASAQSKAEPDDGPEVDNGPEMGP